MTTIDQDTLVKKGEMLPIMEHFYTIQGEGFQSGKAAYFIRIGGCDVGCHWCDVKESWQAANHPLHTVKDIADLTKSSLSSLVVITGGEPVMYQLNPITSALKKLNKTICLETSGAYSLSGQFDWVCLSPKKNKAPLDEYYDVAQELKVIIFNNDDFKWAESHKEKVNKNCKLYLQVEWSKSETMLPKIIEYVKNHPEWTISVQSHKFINVP